MIVLKRRSALAAVVLAAGCSRPQTRTAEPYAGTVMKRPDRVLVSYFAVSPDDVQLDQSLGARVRRTFGDQPTDATMMDAARETQAVLATDLVARLRGYGLPAELGGTFDAGTVLLVRGQIVAIDQGNRARRMLIGLGAGRSTVTADAQLYYVSGPAQPRFLTAFEGEADSGHMPGAAETMGAGAAAQRIGTSAALTGGTHLAGEQNRAADTAEAAALAKTLALRIGTFAVSQGWLPPDAVR
jgi:hypothetical protein